MRKLRITLEIYKDFGKSFYKVWANVLHNYITIFVSLFGKKALNLHVALANFYKSIYKLLMVYNW